MIDTTDVICDLYAPDGSPLVVTKNETVRLAIRH